jgi:hypothetical protein
MMGERFFIEKRQTSDSRKKKSETLRQLTTTERNDEKIHRSILSRDTKNRSSCTS